MAANGRAAGGTRTLRLLGTSEAPRYLGLGGKRSDKVLPRQGALPLSYGSTWLTRRDSSPRRRSRRAALGWEGSHPATRDLPVMSGVVQTAFTARGLRPCSWTSVDSVQQAGLRPLRFAADVDGSKRSEDNGSPKGPPLQGGVVLTASAVVGNLGIEPRRRKARGLRPRPDPYGSSCPRECAEALAVDESTARPLRERNAVDRPDPVIGAEPALREE